MKLTMMNALMVQREFAERAKMILATDDVVLGLAVAGSWLTQQMDAFSDLDLIVVTKERISDDKGLMLDIAKRLGNLLSGFTGEHVGEPRLLICLYDDPLLHVDIKFLTLGEFHSRIETPSLLLDKDGQLEQAIRDSQARFPYPDHQWIEDRFWTWVHYVLLKIGRGEYLEAHDFMGFLRMVVLGPLLHIKNGNLPRGVRRVETDLQQEDMERLRLTIPTYDRRSLLDSLMNAVVLYKQLRSDLYDDKVALQHDVETKVMRYFETIEHLD